MARPSLQSPFSAWMRALPLGAATPLLVFFLTLLCFAPATRNQFVNWDDYGTFLNNPSFRGLGWEHWRWAFTTLYRNVYNPLVWVSFGWDHALWGLDPFGYHLTDVLLHSANAALFYLVALRLLGGKDSSSQDRLGAAFAALAFSLHPLRVESVAWASERRDTLSGFFFLLTVGLWLRAVGGGGRRWLFAAWAAHLAALFSKVTVVTLPAVLVLLDLYVLRRLPRDPRLWGEAGVRGVWLEKAPFAAASAAVGAVGFFAMARGHALSTLGQAGLGERAAASLFGLGFYMSKTLWPFALSPLYERRWAADPVPFLAAWSFAAAVAGTLWAGRRRWPWGLGAFAYYAVTLLPVLGLVKAGHQTAADRYTYLPCLAWALLAGAGVGRLSRRLAPSQSGARAAFHLGAAALLAGLAVLTRAQIPVWRDSLSLWSRVLTLNPAVSVGRPNLAAAWLERGRADMAALALEEQGRVYPRDADSRKMLDALLARVEHPRQFLAKAHNDRGVELLERGELERAVWHFMKCVELDPALPLAYNNWGAALYRQGKPGEAARRYEQFLRLAPDSREGKANLALARARLGAAR